MLAFREFISFILLTFMVYPCWLVVSAINNSLYGDKSLIIWAQWDSKRGLLNTLINDWSQSLQTSALIVFGLLLPLYFLLKYSGYYNIFNFMLSAISGLLLLCLYFVGFDLHLLTNTASSGFVLVLLLIILLKLFALPKPYKA